MLTNALSHLIHSNFPATGKTYTRTSMVRHKGTVIAFAMDSDRRIVYSVLNLQPDVNQTGDSNSSVATVDKNAWTDPRELIFPSEIAEVGFGVADQTAMPVFKKGSAKPEIAGTLLPPNRPDEYDYFLSTTARFSADAPFQALSDGQYVYIFRQAIASPERLSGEEQKSARKATVFVDSKGHLLTSSDGTETQLIWRYKDEDSTTVTDAGPEGKLVPLVDSTLLVDRFLLVGTQLQSKLEVRYQRSRSKTRPQSRKDSLDAKDLDGNFFQEPTQELKFVGNLSGGRFTALLLPTQVAEVQRWQIFAYNAQTRRMDSVNVERSADGLFNTRGSQVYTCVDHPSVFAVKAGKCVEPSIPDPSKTCGKSLIPRLSTTGYAESALQFVASQDSVLLSDEVHLGAAFTLEAWINPANSRSTSPTVLIGGGVTTNSKTGVSLLVEANVKLTVQLGEGQEVGKVISPSMLTPEAWSHIAVVVKGLEVRFYVNGRLRAKEGLSTAPTNAVIKSFGKASQSFTGTIDEIRVWNRPRSNAELLADKHQRLTGLEPGLKGYWRFDEADGDTVYDQTNGSVHGTITGTKRWVASKAPVGQSSGIERSCFSFADRGIESGPSALLYYQQGPVASGYDAKPKPVKQAARVMLAVATKTATDTKNTISALDFGVSGSGRLAQMPDEISLKDVIADPASGSKSLNDQLDELGGLQEQSRILDEEISQLTSVADALAKALKTPLGNRDSATDPNSRTRIKLLDDYYKANADYVYWRRLEQTYRDAQVTVYASGTATEPVESRDLMPGEYPELGNKPRGWNDRIKAIKMPDAFSVRNPTAKRSTIPVLQVTAYEHYNRNNGKENAGGLVHVSYDSTRDIGQWPGGWIGNDGNSKLSALYIEASAEFKTELDNAKTQMERAKDALTNDLKAKQDLQGKIQSQLAQKRISVEQGATAAMPLVATDPYGLTISGGQLQFAWTKDTPLLFDSATGNLALYFRGTDDQFFVVYYTTQIERARYTLKSKTEEAVGYCVARSADLDADKLSIEISSAENNDTCTVTITGAGITETWQEVPRDPGSFAKVLNGGANTREFIGKGKITFNNGRFNLEVADEGVSRDVSAGTTLMVGNQRVRVQAPADRNATTIALFSGTAIVPSENLPIFYLEYDYVGNAQTTKTPADLYNGSLLIAVADPLKNTPLANQRATSDGTLKCMWTAARPGSALVFDGAKAFAEFTDAANSSRFDPKNDLTIETWLRPGNVTGTACLVQHQSTATSYSIDLVEDTLKTALSFDGKNEYVEIPHAEQFNFDSPQDFTVEVWVRIPRAATGTNVPDESIIIQKWSVQTGYPFPFSIQVYEGRVTALQRDVTGALSRSTSRKLDDGIFHHIAFVKKQQQFALYIDGILENEQDATSHSTIGTTTNDAPLFIGRGEQGNNFIGEIDEVRIWKRARSAEQILSDMRRRLGSNETDLVGYWHFGGGTAKDYSRFQNDGTVYGTPQQVGSPLRAFKPAFTFNGSCVTAGDSIPAGNWTHLAATFNQPNGVQFDGRSNYIDCGTADTLNIDGDLTIEVSLQTDALGHHQGILSKGLWWPFDFDVAERLPYSLILTPEGKIVFLFQDVSGDTHKFESDPITPNNPHRIAVTRHRRTLTYSIENSNKQLAPTIYTFVWYDIAIYIDGTLSKEYKYAKSENVGKAIDLALQHSSNNDTDIKKYLAAENGTLVVESIAKSKKPLELGRAAYLGLESSYFQGVISEVRIWNKAVDADRFIRLVDKDEPGLVAWWLFKERKGSSVADSAGKSTGTIIGTANWTKDNDPARAALTLYINGRRLTEQVRTTLNPRLLPKQFTVGARRLDQSNLDNRFQGEMQELRLWQTVRTEEQIQDNFFRRLLGDQQELLAYYTFATDSGDKKKLSDTSLGGSHLSITNPTFVLSSAPIGDDAPQVRSALAGVKTTFNDSINSTPSLQEYGDLQYDSQGNMIGAFKRCYSFIKDGAWQILTGFKVGDIVTEWIGQVQFAPQLMGYIEGAPPVPSENLTASTPTASNFNNSIAIEVTEAQSTRYTYAASKNTGFDMTTDLKGGYYAYEKTSAGIGLEFSTGKLDFSVGAKTKLEHVESWLEDATGGTGRVATGTTRLRLRGAMENPDAAAYPALGRRFVPENLGMALVQSQTADVYALRLKQNGALISFQMRPNPDIPKDWNIINFPINARYTKQGTLDGKIGLQTDVSFPNAFAYSSDTSYFKPLEAYKLKNDIRHEEMALQTFFDAYDSGNRGRGTTGGMVNGSLLANIPNFGQQAAKEKQQKRNLVNTYVWTADGGFFAETEQTLDVWQERAGGAYTFKQTAGVYVDFKGGIPVLGGLGQGEALFGGHQNLTVTKTKDSQTSFGLAVDLNGLPVDVYQRDSSGNLVMDASDPQRIKPKRQPGKVDAYRFMSFYLEPGSEHYDHFYNRVVDPVWLEQSGDPSAAALREARQDTKKPACWRILHRVTYVSRILPPLDLKAPASLEKTLQTLDIDSNYELIKQLEPFVGDKLTSIAEFSTAVDQGLEKNLPELLPHATEIKDYLSHYFGVADLAVQGRTGRADDTFGTTSLFDRVPNQPPIVSAGADRTQDRALGLDGFKVLLKLDDARVIDDRLNQTSALFVTWEKVSGDGDVSFDDAHQLAATATIAKRGRYGLRLTASDGQLSASDELTVVVNEPPRIKAGPSQDIAPNGIDVLLRELTGDANKVRRDWLTRTLKADQSKYAARLKGVLLDDGSGDPLRPLTFKWSKAGGLGNVTWENDQSIDTLATFDRSGNYLLQLEVSNDSFTRNAQVMISVAARVTRNLEVLYTFEEGRGKSITDVSGNEPPVNLQITSDGGTWISGGLKLDQPLLIASDGAASRVTDAVKNSAEITIEAWIKTPDAALNGLARIITVASGPGRRNFLLGQDRSGYHAGLRTTIRQSAAVTDLNASRTALSAGPVDSSKLTHLVCTHERTGLTRLFVDGSEKASRTVNGTFEQWDSSFKLALGNELDSSDGIDRAWRGEFHLAAIYSRALTESEVAQNFAFGPDANIPPVVFAGPDLVINWASGPSASVTQKMAGRVIDDRQSSTINLQWEQIGGPDKCVSFQQGTEPAEPVATFTQKGRYTLRLTANDGELTASDEVTVLVNRRPELALVSKSLALALVNQTVSTPLAVTLLDSGLGDEAERKQVTYLWRKTNGPTAVQLAAIDTPQATASFTGRGVYELEVEVGNGYLNGRVQAKVTVNQKPAVTVDGTQVKVINLPPTTSGQPNGSVQVELKGQITDSGLGDPNHDSLNIEWQKLSGPADVTFTNSAQANTTVSFTEGGIYTLRLTASHPKLSELTGSTDVAITVNRIPVVDAGVDRTINTPNLPVEIALDATVSDDGLPEKPGTLTLKWSRTSGPEGVTFDADNTDYSIVTVPAKGKYTFRLEANDGAATAADSTEITVNTAPKVNVNNDQIVSATTTVGLQGKLIDDGLAVPGPVPTYEWQKLGGPAVTFGQPTALTTTAEIESGKRSLLQLVARNGFISGTSRPLLVERPKTAADRILLYSFKEGGGTQVGAVAGSLNGAAGLTIKDTGNSNPAIWRPEGGLTISGASTLLSPASVPNAMVIAIKETKAFSVEVWLKPSAGILQDPSVPARILTLSRTVSDRNFSLQQGKGGNARADFYHIRLRTSATDAEGGQGLQTPDGSLTATRQHVVVVYSEATATITVYINGIIATSGSAPGSISAWQDGYQLALGNEVDGQRPWSGTLYLAALYNRPLTAEEVQQRYTCGI